MHCNIPILLMNAYYTEEQKPMETLLSPHLWLQEPGTVGYQKYNEEDLFAYEIVGFNLQFLVFQLVQVSPPSDHQNDHHQ